MISKSNILKELKIFLLWYAMVTLLLLGVLYIIILSNDFNESSWEVFTKTLPAVLRFGFAYLLPLIPYVLFIIIRSLTRDFKKKRIKGLLKGVGFKIVLPASSIWLILLGVDYYRGSEEFNYQWDSSVENTTSIVQNLGANDDKQRGMHIFDLLSDSMDLEILKTNNFEWLTFVPFISQEGYNLPNLQTRFNVTDSVESYKHWLKIKNLSNQYGFKIMIKPHIWLFNQPEGKWRSDINMKNQEDWDIWFDAYDAYILRYAKLAETLNIEMFCIGTELHTTVLKQPERWLSLIEKVRSAYSGKLTYAANWNQEVNDVPFWSALDFIGIQAYFPIAVNENPEIKELEAGWNKHIDFLSKLHQKNDKPILFTEMGYKATPDAGITPWEWNDVSNRFYKKISKKTQALCYQAFFNTVWRQPWFEGVHLWKWQAHGESDGNNNAFNLENKPALNIIAKGFNKN